MDLDTRYVNIDELTETLGMNYSFVTLACQNLFAGYKALKKNLLEFKISTQINEDFVRFWSEKPITVSCIDSNLILKHCNTTS